MKSGSVRFFASLCCLFVQASCAGVEKLSTSGLEKASQSVQSYYYCGGAGIGLPDKLTRRGVVLWTGKATLSIYAGKHSLEEG